MPPSEEFLQSLYKGGELLAAGKVIEAKDHLERAHQLQPKNEKGQNLLGLAYFKLGLFDQAAGIYETLVRENPVDPTLRVNLGLVYLKTNLLPRAIKEFETATDLAPEHKKAHNYLGLALAQQGNYAEAKEHFIAAGSDAMAQKMERALAGESTGLNRVPPFEGSEAAAERGSQPAVPPRISPVVSGVKAAALPPPPPEPPPEVEVEVTEEPPPTEANDWGAHFKGEDEELRFAEDEGPEEQPVLEAHPDEQEPAPIALSGMAAAVQAAAGHDQPREPGYESDPVPAAGHVPDPPAVAAVRASADALSHLGPTRTVLKAQPTTTAPFEVTAEGVTITVRSELLTRIDGLLLTTGHLKFAPELKRFRGRATEQPFGEANARMMRATGNGVLVVESDNGERFESIDLGEESAYFREDAVYAFEEAVMYENGRVPSEVTGDLDLVHLRGAGKVLLRLGGALRTHPVRQDIPVTVPLTRLVGWYGNVTPRLFAVATEESGHVVEGGVELTGEGFVLFSAPIR